MKFYDVYNGDADGLCALQQLRLAQPRESVLVSGVKRDINLLQRVDAQPGDEIVVLDVSLDTNRNALEHSLSQGARVRWFDHHHPGPIPDHQALTAHIDTDPRMCTSLIVNRHLGGQFPYWAVTAAFGDNLDKAAHTLAAEAGLSESDTSLLRRLGTCMNYNAYGKTVEDLHVSPITLYQQMRPFSDPRDFIEASGILAKLEGRMDEDLELAMAIPVQSIADGSAYAVLPDASWSRRVSGLFANRLSQDRPDTAHAILTESGDGYVVSIRAPIAKPRGASTVARAFRSGGGREGAAGIDFLPAGQLDDLLALMRNTYRPGP